MNFTAILSFSLEYDTLQPALKDSVDNILSSFVDEGSIFTEEEKELMKYDCLIESEHVFVYENYTFVIPCQIVEQGESAIIDYVVEDFTNQIYYAEYNCEFWDCVKNSEMPFVLISKKSYDYWKGKFFLLLFLSLIIFTLIFFISKNRPGRFIVGGILLIFSALPFKRMDWLLRFIPENISQLFLIFFTKAHSVFRVMLVIGILFISFGIICKVFGWKMKLKKDEEVLKKEQDSKKDEVLKKDTPILKVKKKSLK
jgi:hypothetical protein